MYHFLKTSDCPYTVEPFFFGEPPAALFGCYHRPQRVPDRGCGIVLCHPVGQEYIQSHRSVYQLAVQLTRIGFHVLRFDYFGCGDSGGDFEQGSLRQWTLDIQTAARALALRSDQGRIVLLGLRLGATLAMMAAAQSDAFETLVLWEPILDGRRYFDEMTEMHKSFIQRSKVKKNRQTGLPEGVLGFPLTTEFKKEIEAIQPERMRLRPGMRLLAISNNLEAAHDKSLKRFLQGHAHAEHLIIGDHRAWYEELYKRLIPVTTINFLVNWIDKAHQ
ncbi:MAG: alpha/beta fold hydrolase [Desulfobacteraceae bacterium]|nr:MAG: alpha/beta fold hydrolase [Desulfobacteraceae bacterium]